VRFLRFFLFACILPFWQPSALATSLAESKEPNAQSGATPRVRTAINTGWRYAEGDISGAEAIGYDDSRWTATDLPHTWNAQDTQDDTPGYRRGIGWYRKRLALPANLKGKRLFIFFEGANQIAEVFVNGRKVGEHRGGYTAFTFDITEFVRFDSPGPQLIAVRVNNAHNKDIPPLSADFNFYGGIYRNVWLVATEQTHLDLLDHGSSGLFLDTPSVSEASAVVRVRGTVANDKSAPAQVRIVSRIVDSAGKNVAVVESSLRIGAGEKAGFEHSSRPLVNPHLWSPDQPYLYTVSTQIYLGTHLADSFTSALGIRWFRIDADKGFFLNGKPLRLRGTNRHQDYKGMGNAVPDSIQIRDMQIIKEMGANFVRLAHYPQAPAVLEAADRLGLIIWEEIPIVDYITTSNAFAANCRNMLVEMIRQHYNHASILMWGYMNEVLIKLQKEDGYVEKVVALARQLDQLARREDPNRATVMACHQNEIYNTSGLANVPQALGWNLYFGWYGGSFAGLGPFLDEQHRRFPKRPIFVSEYGGDADQRLHSRNPERFDYTIEWQQRLHESYLRQVEERPFLAGTTLWVQYDFGSEARGESRPHMNQKGLLTFDRKPKDIYFLYQARFSNRTVLHIATRDWLGKSSAIADANNEHVASYPVDVFTNLPQVELFVNGRSLGAKSVSADKRVTWDVPFNDGINLLDARGVDKDQTQHDSARVQFAVRHKILSDPAFPFKELTIDAGSNSRYLDETGTLWEPDQAYLHGSWGFIGGKAVKTAQNIAGTDDDRLYQLSREGLTSYRFDVPEGRYRVELLFCEPTYTEQGKRVFSVSINGKPVIRDLDLAKEHGAAKPLKQSFEIQTTGNIGLEINFSATAGSPIISAVRITRP
jgi:beta-galactosidase